MSDYRSVPSIGKRVGEFLILALYLAVDVEEIWPKSHVWALIAVVVGIGALLLLDGELSTKRIIVITAALCFACVIFYELSPAPSIQATPPVRPADVVIAAPDPQMSPATPRTFESGPGIPFEDTEVKGVLKPAMEPTPPNACDRGPVEIDALKVLIGSITITHNGFGAFTAIGIGACDAISMERRTEGIFVNANLYDKERQAVVSIRDNKITALNGENYSARQNRDESRLIVKNAHGTEIFYIRYLNPTTIQFRGFLGCAGGTAIHVQEGQPVPGFFMSNGCLGNVLRGIQIGPQ